jgi:hypothetical protein
LCPSGSLEVRRRYDTSVLCAAASTGPCLPGCDPVPIPSFSCKHTYHPNQEVHICLIHDTDRHTANHQFQSTSLGRPLPGRQAQSPHRQMPSRRHRHHEATTAGLSTPLNCCGLRSCRRATSDAFTPCSKTLRDNPPFIVFAPMAPAVRANLPTA